MIGIDKMKKEEILENQDIIHTQQAALRVHRHTLVEMNRSVYTARRNASYHFFVQFLKKIQLETTKEQRLGEYQEALQWVEQILSDTIRSQIVPESPLIKCLKVLRCTLTAVESLLEYEISLANEVESLTKESGSNDMKIFSSKDRYSINEESVLHAILDLSTVGLDLLKKDYEERRASFAEDDYRRYDKAYQEYKLYFDKKVGPTNA